MICSNCQNRISEGDKFCGYCGQKTKRQPTELGINTDKEPLNEKDTTKIKGLGGWLILVGIGLFIALVYRVYSFFESISLFLDENMSILSNQSSEFYISGLNMVMKFELLIEITAIIAIIYLIYLFSSKKKKFPNAYIAFMVIFLILSVIDTVWGYNLEMPTTEIQKIYSNELDTSLQDIAQAFLTTIIWGLYIVKSKRVKATFVE